jgi:hypothetical protein
MKSVTKQIAPKATLMILVRSRMANQVVHIAL